MNSDPIGLTKKIHKILGSSNCIIIVPDSFPYAGKENLLTVFAMAFIKSIEAYAVINCKYKNSIINLDHIDDVKKNQRITNEFLKPLYTFKEEIRGNKKIPVSLVLKTNNSSPEALSKVDITIGTGQGERGNPRRKQRSTFPPSLLTKLRTSLADSGFTTELAPTESSYCGRKQNCLNQLFFQKNFVEDNYDPNCQSLVFTFSPQALGKTVEKAAQNGQKMAEGFSHLINEMPLVRQVQMTSIEAVSPNDKKFIFRVTSDEDVTQSLTREGYIEELADSIKQSGLLHPLVLLQKDDGNYKILCGFRRYQAISRLGRKWVEAKVYKEDSFSKEEFFNISLAENTKRKNLNPVEIGNFLESAAQELGLNNAHLAEKFGQTLGIGKPNTKVSQSTIHKYRKINSIRTSKESPEIIRDIINEQLQFTIAAEILAPIKNHIDRNNFYFDIIKPLQPTRPQILQIKKLFDGLGSSYTEILIQPTIKQYIEKALHHEACAIHFINRLKTFKNSKTKSAPKNPLQKKTAALQSILLHKDMRKSDLKLIPSKNRMKNEFTIQVKIRPDNIQEAIKTLSTIVSHQQQVTDIFKKD